MRPTCSIVVPSTAAADALDLTALLTLSMTTTDAEVVEIRVVGATDTTRLAEGAGARVSVVPCAATGGRQRQPGDRCGFAEAANAGASAAHGTYLLFLDAAVRPQADLLDTLVRHAEQSPRAAVCGGKLLGPGDTIEQAGIVLDQEGCPRQLYAGLPGGHAAANRTRRLQIVSAACMLVRREVFIDANGFDTAFCAEDAACDFCLRLGERGHEVHYVPAGVGVWSSTSARIAQPDAARSRRLFRTRWIHKIQPDDLACYQQDGLLRLQYDEGMPVRAIVAAPLEVATPAHIGAAAGAATAAAVAKATTVATAAVAASAAAESERLLAERARQVRTLLEENARLADRIAVLEATTAEPDGLLPPPDLELSVGGRFREVGEEFLAHFVNIGGLQPTDHVLDVGCGVGRMAVPLTRYLTSPGSYDGFDIVPRAIAWCQTHITPRFPHFHFQHVPLRNLAYNAQATQTAASFRFPYPPATFDFVILTSVFTHLVPDAARHYVSQVAAVLKPGGRCFCTFFLINPESQGLIHAGLSPTFPFAHRVDDGCRTLDPSVPEAAIAYDETRVRAWLDAEGLHIADPIRYGTWCGRLDGPSLQDIIVAMKR